MGQTEISTAIYLVTFTSYGTLLW